MSLAILDAQKMFVTQLFGSRSASAAACGREKYNRPHWPLVCLLCVGTCISTLRILPAKATPLRTSIPSFASLVLIACCVFACASANSQVQVPASAAQSRDKFNDPAQYEARDLPVTDRDLLTLERAAELLASESKWNRNDDRRCDDDEALDKRSLFCALQRASADAYGSHDSSRVADHRRVALQEVRFAVEEATRGRELEHRMMDFNNLPDTTFADIHRVLVKATARVKARLSAD